MGFDGLETCIFFHFNEFILNEFLKGLFDRVNEFFFYWFYVIFIVGSIVIKLYTLPHGKDLKNFTHNARVRVKSFDLFAEGQSS